MKRATHSRRRQRRIPGRIEAWTALVGLMVVVISAGSAWAVPARPDAVTVRQPDGTEITVLLRGDEFAHWYETPDGHLVVKQTATGRWVYAIEVNGQPQPTELVVGRDDPKGIEALAPAVDRVRAAAKVHRSAKLVERSSPQRAGPRGTMQNLVIPVNFTDETISHTREQFDDLFNEAGHSFDGASGSVKDFYDEISYGALTMASTVVEPVTVDHDAGYYGQNDAWGEDLRPAALARDALAKVEARGFDFATMDGDGDGYVDCLTIVHAGEGEENGNEPNMIWSHKWELGNPVTYDGVVLEQYVIVPAIRGAGGGIIRIGVICHELGHHLGLPDLYDIDGSSTGVGDFCVMSYGSWGGGDGETPTHMSAWCKIALDWVQPTVVSVAGTYSLGQAATNAEVLKIQGSFSANEYFLIENRQGTGFDVGLPGASRGILIWHVDDTQTTNEDETHFLVDLEEADGDQELEAGTGVGSDADYFREGNATVFDDSSTPSNHSYDGSPLGFSVRDIGPTGTTMTLSVAMDDPMEVGGWIRLADGAGIDGVLVTEDKDGGWDITDTNGYYHVPVRVGWSGTITPAKAGYTFGPASRTYENVREDIGGQNYTGVEDATPTTTGTLSVQTVDEAAQAVDGGIYVDGEYKGDGTWSGDVAVGSHQVTFGNLTGYTKPAGQAAAVEEGETTDVVGTYVTDGGDDSTLAVVVTASPNLVASRGTSLVTATATGGTPPYDYEWNTGFEGWMFIAEPKATVTYRVTVTDSVDATVGGSVTVEVPTTPLVVTVQADPNIVQPGQSSTLTATASGGVTPYEYEWGNGETTAQIVVTPDGATNYSVTVSDLSGQEVIGTVSVLTPEVAAAQSGGGDAAPCFAPAAPVAMLLVALIAWRAIGATRPPRRRVR